MKERISNKPTNGESKPNREEVVLKEGRPSWVPPTLEELWEWKQQSGRQVKYLGQRKS